MAVLELQNVKYTYKTQYQSVEVLKGVNQTFEAGKIYAVIGKSGSGKTTMLSLMAGLDLPTEGEILCDDVPMSQMKLEQYRRERVAVIYQSFRLFPLLTVAENVMYPMELRGIKPKEAREKAAELISRVGLSDVMLNRFPGQLSGGEQQRVAIARAMGMDTRILLADEPTGNLDEANSKQVMDILLDLAHSTDRCVIIVTHDLDLASRTDCILHMRDGVLS
ncbi:MAG: ABC transporter ATP-binding protein [Oscillospiraceae bacterium]|nr:ABC transporter ATP-binding protein [Oscillospiraceae bacterium]